MKVKTEFLKKVIRNRGVCTKNYYYKNFDYSRYNEERGFYSFSIIKRIDIEYLDTTKYLDETNWEKIALTIDGEKFTRF